MVAKVLKFQGDKTDVDPPNTTCGGVSKFSGGSSIPSKTFDKEINRSRRQFR